jgi:hypothetical protein
MRTAIIVTVLLIFCVLAYVVGYRSGSKRSPLREDLELDLVYAINMYRAAETTNLTKLHSFLDIKILAYTRDYERRFGVPPPANTFARDFAEAQALAAKIEQRLVPVSAIGAALGSNVSVTVESGK